jgi:hypothetical protein
VCKPPSHASCVAGITGMQAVAQDVGTELAGPARLDGGSHVESLFCSL